MTTYYVDDAAKDLASALQGPVGKTCLGGDRGAIIDILATSSCRLEKHSEAAWLCITTRDLPYAVIVSTTRVHPSWQPAMQRFEDIASLRVASQAPTPVGEHAVIELREPSGAEFRPFLLRSDMPLWLPICITTRAPLDGEFTDHYDMPPGATSPRRWRDFRAFDPGIDMGASPNGAARTWRLNDNGKRTTVGYLIVRRIASPSRDYEARGAGAAPSVFRGCVDYALRRDAIRALEAATLDDALALAPFHAQALRREIPARGDYRRAPV